MADEVVLVATPEPTSITDAYAVAKLLFRKRPNAPIAVSSTWWVLRTKAKSFTTPFRPSCSSSSTKT